MVYQKKRKFPINEKKFMLKYLERLKATAPRKIWLFKVHGEPMQVRGIPDVIICYLGLFVCLEFKIRRHGKLNITPYQAYSVECITEANGIALVVWYDEDSSEVGIGVRKFIDIEESVKWLVGVLDASTMIPCGERVIKQ